MPHTLTHALPYLIVATLLVVVLYVARDLGECTKCGHRALLHRFGHRDCRGWGKVWEREGGVGAFYKRRKYCFCKLSPEDVRFNRNKVRYAKK